MKMKYQRYRVYPARGRARSFKYLDNAIDFARDSFVAQGLAVVDQLPVVICYGSGSDYKEVGRWDVQGFVRYSDGARVLPNH